MIKYYHIFYILLYDIYDISYYHINIIYLILKLLPGTSYLPTYPTACFPFLPLKEKSRSLSIFVFFIKVYKVMSWIMTISYAHIIISYSQAHPYHSVFFPSPTLTNALLFCLSFGRKNDIFKSLLHKEIFFYLEIRKE